METPMNYALRLLKIKNYYIKEIFDKLSKKYTPFQVHSTIKELILNDYINDKKLLKLKMNYFVYVKRYSKKYIKNYFETKGISSILINNSLSNYSEDVFVSNRIKIIENLKLKGKSENYIKKYLVRNGYDEE